MAASRADLNLRDRQAESDIEMDMAGVDLECWDLDFGKFFESE